MEGFKKLPKMQHFKTGGSVKCAPAAKCSGGKMKEGGKADIAQDKAIVKKAFAMHDKQEHKGEKTDLSKLKKGGRSKKAVGTVKKFEKASGEYGAKKTAQDKKNIQQAKQFKKGGKVKKYEEGKLVKGQGAISDTERAAAKSAAVKPTTVNENDRMAARAKNALDYLGPAQQAEFVKQGGMNPVPSNVGAPAGSTVPGQKRGGKVKRGCK